MRKTLSILMISSLPALALASGDHAGGHGDHSMPGHDMSGMHEDMHGHEAGHALGKPGDPARVTRTIDVGMDDNMRFTPERIEVKAGETVRFFVKNHGRLTHEMVIGDMAQLKEHATMMRKMPGMQHAEPNMISLAPGQRGGIVWEFDKAGTVAFACLVPGHLEAGMVGEIIAR